MKFLSAIFVLGWLVFVFSQEDEVFDKEKGLSAGWFPKTDPNEKSASTAVYGVDFSTLASASSSSCFVSSGYIFASVRGYRSSGVVDSNMCSSLKNLKAAGMPVNDVYLFPCEYSGKVYSSINISRPFFNFY